MSLNLPAELSKDGRTLTASTPSEYWSLRYRGYREPVADNEEDELTPQQKAARTRAANRAQEEQRTSADGPTDTAGTAAGDES